jgi:hypothetical protein
MAVDLSLAVRIAENVVVFFVGVLLNRFIERRPRLTAYYGHVGVFRVAPPPGSPPNAPVLLIHTHTVVIGNAGRLAAHNVRVPHRGPLGGANINVHVEPGINYSTQILQGGQEEILFPILVPKQQITISYLYFPPITFQTIHLPIRCDEGVAVHLNVIPTLQRPRWLNVLLLLLAMVGVGATLYGVFELARWAGVTFSS